MGRLNGERPGRFRRYVLRSIFWSLAMLALLVFGLRLWIDSDPARDWAKGQIEQRVSSLLDGREVTLDDVSFELLPLSVTLRGLEIAGTRPTPLDGDSLDGEESSDGAQVADPESEDVEVAPFLHVPYAFLEADLFALERRRVHLRLVRVERPEVDLRFFSGGGDNLIQGRGAGDGDFELVIDQVEIIGGELALDHARVPLQLDTGALRAELRGLGEGQLEGRLTAQEVLVELPSARPVRVSVVVEGGLDAERLWVEHGEAIGEGISGTFDGGCRWPRREDRLCSFGTQGRAQGAFLAKLGYFRSLRGEFEFEGEYGWRPGSIGWSGRVGAERLRLWDRRLSGLAGRLAADRFGVRLDLERARYARGYMNGTVQVDVKEPRRPLTVDLRYDEIFLDDLLADQGIPVDGFAARVSGDVLYRCPLRRCRSGDGQAEVAIWPDPESPGMPIEGQFPLRVDYGEIYAEAADVVNARQSLLATGSYSLLDRAGRFDYQIETADVGELVPLLPLPRVPDYLPQEGSGHLEGSFLVRGGQVWSSVEGSLDQVSTSRTPAITNLEGGFDVTPWAIENLRLAMNDLPKNRPIDAEVSADSTLNVTGRLPFEGVADLSFDAVRVPMSVVRPWVEIPVDLEGQVTGQLELALGAVAEREVNAGQLIAILAPARIAGLDADGLQAEMSWSDGVVRFGGLSLLCEAGPIDAVGSLDWSSGAIELDLSAEALDLRREPFATYLPRRDLGGEVDLAGSLGGRLGEPVLELDAEVRRIEVAGRRLAGETKLDVEWRDRVLRAGASLLGVAEIRGGGRLDDERADLGLQVQASDLARLTELLDLGGRRLDGELAGRLQISGELESLAARLQIERLLIDLDRRVLENIGTAIVALEPTGFQIDTLRLIEEATASEIGLSGVGSWDGDFANLSLDLALAASLDLDWLAYALPDIESAGRLTLDGRLGGTLSAPEVRGTGSLEDGMLEVPGLAERFSNLNGLLLFEGDRARIEDVRGAFAGGEASLSGVVDLQTAPGERLDYRLQLEGRDLSFAYLDGWALAGDTDLALRSIEDGHLLSGEARLERLEYLEDIRFDVGSLVRDALRGQRLQVDPAAGLRSEIQLEVQVKAPAAVRVRNNLADLRGDADFSLRGHLAQPVIFGEIEMHPGGRLEYNETDYDLERGRLTFSDPYRLLPEVDIEASTRVRDIDVKLALSGPVERLEARFSSEPPLPDVEVFRLLAGGDAFLEEDADLVAERTAQLGEDPGTSAATFLYGQAATVLGRRVNDLFRFDRFRIDPLTGADDNLSKARVTLGKRLSKDVFVTYSVDPSSTDNQRIQVEWQVADGLILVLTQNGDDSFSADARWETSF